MRRGGQPQAPGTASADIRRSPVHSPQHVVGGPLRTDNTGGAAYAESSTRTGSDRLAVPGNDRLAVAGIDRLAVTGNDRLAATGTDRRAVAGTDRLANGARTEGGGRQARARARAPLLRRNLSPCWFSCRGGRGSGGRRQGPYGGAEGEPGEQKAADGEGRGGGAGRQLEAL